MKVCFELKVRNLTKQKNIYVTKSQWMWYENWIPVVEQFCKEDDERRKKNENVSFKPGQIVQMIKDNGFSYL